MDRDLPRYQPEAPLPKVPYWPGINGKDPHFRILPRQSSEEWSADPGYLHGIDLFNHGCYWEAHEAWEDLWLPLPKESTLRIFIQGLIQASAALLKIRLRQQEPASSIWQRGKNRLESVLTKQDDGCYRGVDIPDFCLTIDKILHENNSEFESPTIRLKKSH